MVLLVFFSDLQNIVTDVVLMAMSSTHILSPSQNNYLNFVLTLVQSYTKVKTLILGQKEYLFGVSTSKATSVLCLLTVVSPQLHFLVENMEIHGL